MKELIETNPKLDGWCELPKAITLFNLVTAKCSDRKYKDDEGPVIVEVGVFGGRSAIPMMLACKQSGRGIVHCIDPWSPDASREGQVTDVDIKWWGNLNHEMVYQKFVSFVDRLGLKEQCEIHRMKSSEFDGPARIDVVHVDGNHGPDALTDTIKFASRVDQGGYVILDDCNWHGGYVTKSAEWLKENGFLELHQLGTGALFYKK